MKGMNIGEFLKINDIYTHTQLEKMKRIKQELKQKEIIELGDKPERLMQHNAYKRIGRRIRQVKWG